MYNLTHKAENDLFRCGFDHGQRKKKELPISIGPYSANPQII